MILLLEVRWGPSAGKGVRLRPGQSVRVGRTGKSDFMLPADSHLSGTHFEVALSENECRIRDLKSTNGTLLNGHGVTEAVLHNGDIIIAGETAFRVTLGEGDAPSPAPHPSIAVEANPLQRLAALLANDYQPLYAILDAARAQRLPALLTQSQEEHQSLYEGEQSKSLSQVAPYLVRLDKNSLLLRLLVYEGWGKGWGVYLACAGQFQDLRRHLQKFLEVTLPDGKQVYFRFYDPRVLRQFFANCNADESNKFFGPITHYLLEDDQPEILLQFVNSGKGADRKAFDLSPAAISGDKTMASAMEHRTVPLEKKAGEGS